MVLLQSRYDTLKQGDAAPDFTLKNITGRDFTLNEAQDYDGYLIIFMCNHCPYVLPKIQTLINLQNEFPNIMLIGINSNNNPNYPDDSFEKMQQYTDEWGLNFDYLFDEDQSIAKLYGATCTPDPFLFDKDKKLVYHGRLDPEHGEESDGSDMRLAITRMLNGEPVSDEKMYSQGCSIKWQR